MGLISQIPNIESNLAFGARLTYTWQFVVIRFVGSVQKGSHNWTQTPNTSSPAESLPTMAPAMDSLKSDTKNQFPRQHRSWVPSSDVSAVSSSSSTSTASIPIPIQKPSHNFHADLEEADYNLHDRLMDAEWKDVCMQERIYGYSIMEPTLHSHQNDSQIKRQAMTLDHAHAKLLTNHRPSRAADGPPLTVSFSNQDTLDEAPVFDFEL